MEILDKLKKLYFSQDEKNREMCKYILSGLKDKELLKKFEDDVKNLYFYCTDSKISKITDKVQNELSQMKKIRHCGILPNGEINSDIRFLNFTEIEYLHPTLKRPAILPDFIWEIGTLTKLKLSNVTAIIPKSAQSLHNFNYFSTVGDTFIDGIENLPTSTRFLEFRGTRLGLFNKKMISHMYELMSLTIAHTKIEFDVDIFYLPLKKLSSIDLGGTDLHFGEIGNYIEYSDQYYIKIK